MTSPNALAPAAVSDVDAQLEASVDLARSVLVDSVPSEQVAEYLGLIREEAHVVTHRFACNHRGYRGWQWGVTLTRVPDESTVTVDEVVLLPGSDAITAPTWVPYRDRLQPGDLSPGDLLPVADDDVRLVPAYLAGDQFAEIGRSTLKATVAELGLGRVRTLSLDGRELAAQRWYDGDRGPETPLAKAAPARCRGCGFLVRIAGPLGDLFGVCANGNANDDGRVVSFDHGCGAHSEVKLARKQQPAPLPDHVFDSVAEEFEEF